MSAVCKIQFGGQFVGKMSITKKLSHLIYRYLSFKLVTPEKSRYIVVTK